MRRKSIITIQKGEIECDALDIIILNGLAVGEKDGCFDGCFGSIYYSRLSGSEIS